MTDQRTPREYSDELDSVLSYYAAIAEMRERHKAGEPLPPMFRPRGEGDE